MSIQEVVLVLITSSLISIEGKMPDFNANIIVIQRQCHLWQGHEVD